MEYKIFRCRKEEFSSIVPRQPYRPELKPNEVRLEFEAVLLDVNKDQKNQLWIHAKIKACVSKKDCDAVSNFTHLFELANLNEIVMDLWKIANYTLNSE